MRYFYPLLFLLFVPCLLQAQASAYLQDGKFPMRAGTLISTNLVSLMEPDGGFSIAVERRMSLRWAMVVEGTLITYSTGSMPTPFAAFRIRPEVRHYFKGRVGKYKGFVGLELLYKQVSNDEEALSAHPGLPGQELPVPVRYTRERRSAGAAMKVGMQLYFDRQKRVLFEMYAGLGLKYRWLDDGGVVIGGLQQVKRGDFFAYNNDYKSGIRPNVPIGVKVGVRLGK
ncbi:hypothetical protein KTO58_16170 [Chitinophaga pendula]|uniref:hypothetical protein n=1 Tax=Chitinophaga TaxID=79328 RepID=UPI000BAEA6E1|nr:MULTISPECIES: hypothetical protein [Chitinophaga]ASZ11752.1 hypothetical protein CK934_12680 [Chitinophaga sp. MD30]UCJ05229.1 hypothetical protein KTO58_16170 [Chitinophaga pendula]